MKKVRGNGARRPLAVGVVLLVMMSTGFLGLSTASAAASVRYCGRITCTDYSSRGEVRTSARSIRAAEARVGRVWDATCGAMTAVAGVVGAAVAGPLGLAVSPVVWIGCEALRHKYGSITDTIKAAADRGQCVAISLPRYGSNNLAFATRWWRYDCNWG